ncbi:Heterokaryon incompatibility [Penicillium frequentans]|uniref:Heterokaryon incompatibility n=1 Tax=Penicillium frequentans TaxID=3151616 RepID=A0AAD6D194_9EURO|nr:Heterokaryon incompatibility [Penicillium glabrum]
MGERYLWADRLCIIQDDADDKKSQIEAMGDIYSSAQLVLVAAYGDSMEYGIPGISAPRKAAQHSEDVLGLRITNVIRDAEDDPLNMWDTRAWTYQEAVLSNRRLSFTDTRAFFECERLICHEDQFNLEEIRNELFSARLSIPEDGSRFQSFTRHLKHYTSRNITYRSDAHKALYGISMSLYKGTDAFLNGLPVVDFDRALLWYPDIGENVIERHEAQGEILPTWSWSSVMGLSDPVHYRAADFYGALAPWYHINHRVESSGSIAALNVDPDSELDDDWQVYMAIAIKEECVRNVSLAFSLATDTFPTVRDLFTTHWKDYHSFRSEALPLTIMTSELPRGISTDAAEKGLIVTEAQTAFLRVTPRPSSSLDIINSEGDIIGGFCGDAAKLREQAISPGFNSHAEFGFISLSLSGAKSYSEDISPKTYIDVDGNSLNKAPIVNVLMIANSGGFSHRRELGWIYLIDWAKLRREWRTIVLE